MVCTGLFDDETETPEDYRALLTRLRARNLFMVCANPDLVVERGDAAGLLRRRDRRPLRRARRRGALRRQAYRPIYQTALAKARRGARQGPRSTACWRSAISVRTDLTGAAAFGLDCLFVTAGIHAEELGGRETPDPAGLNAIFAAAGDLPKAVTRRLVW